MTNDLRERVARAMWESLTSISPEFRDGIWNKSSPDWEAVLPDEDMSRVYSQSPAASPLSRRELLDAADAAIRAMKGKPWLSPT